MNKRPRGRGRYPRVAAVDQLSNSSTQFPSSLTQCPVTSEVQNYLQLQSQPPLNMWNQTPYPNPNVCQQNQAPSVSNPNGFWSTQQTYPTQIQQPSDPWNWTDENNTVNTSFYQQKQQPDPNYQHPNSASQQYKQLDPNYQVNPQSFQHSQQPDPSYQHQNQAFNHNSSNYSQQQSNSDFHPHDSHLQSASGFQHSQQYQQPENNFYHQQPDPNFYQQPQTDITYQQNLPPNPNYQQNQSMDPSFQQNLQSDTSFQQKEQLEIFQKQQQLINTSFQQDHQQKFNLQEYQQHNSKQQELQDLSTKANQNSEPVSKIQDSSINPDYATVIAHPQEDLENTQKQLYGPSKHDEIEELLNFPDLTNEGDWGMENLNITQPADIPWTYNTPQYSNAVTNFPSDSVPTIWNSSAVNAPESMDLKPSVTYLPNDNNGFESALTNSNSCENEVKNDSDSSNLCDCDTSSLNRDLNIDAEFGSNSLSAFFQNSDHNSANDSEYGGASTPDVKNALDSSSLEENLAHLKINDDERSSVLSEDEQEEQNLEDTDNCENQEIHFLQEEIISLDVTDKKETNSSAGFSEEPVNQEVPEPPMQESLSSIPQVPPPVNQSYYAVSPEEPLNQQVPVETRSKSRSTSSERVVIRPLEESPFKPPRINGSSKGIIVQQEITNPTPVDKSQLVEKTVLQEVNLETFPDNLEKPPDYEELRKKSSHYVSHQKHLRTELNSSPSSLLCDNPDIPCVTLAPAAPPIHSSAKSDKSESSNDSRRELASYAVSAGVKHKIKQESHMDSPERVDSELSEKSHSSGKSYPLDLSAGESKDRKMTKSNDKITNTSMPISRSDSLYLEPKQHVPNLPLKESRIQDTSDSDYYQKPVHNIEPLQQPSRGEEYNSRHNYPPSRPRTEPYPPSGPRTDPYPSSGPRTDPYALSGPRTDPRYSEHDAEYSRQRFADRKYPSYDERHYYSDRERSRPPSRSSLDDRSEDYRYPPKSRDPREYPYPQDDRRHENQDYDRPRSRLSETDMRRPDRHGQYDHYKQQHLHPQDNNYPRNQDYYQKPQQNYRGYEYDAYQRDPYYASYYDAYRYAYSNYNYGFYDELYRNDPRYRQYQEQYRLYYAKYGYDGEYERSSAHSGRSSANEFTNNMSSSQYPEMDMSSNASEISAYNIKQDYTYDDVSNEVSISGAASTSTPSARLTPVKFPYAHPIARFSPGGILITAVPSQVDASLPASIKIQTMQSIMENEESYQELKSYQGPLIRGLTHKNDVIDFCHQKIKALKAKEDVVDRDSYILIWELSILMLRQNGSVVGSDIAELLLKDHEVLRSHGVSLRHNIDTPQSEQSPAEVNDSSSQSHAGDISSPDEGIVVLHDKSILNTVKTVDVEKVTRKFREFLLFGHKKDALEWAIKHCLWGHALFLASKMDLRTYANVMTRFANSLVLNDPLQTLYQLMSGRQPSAVTCVADKKWGDWRPHLAMILSNPSGLPDVDSRSITTLGDTLASRGCLPAAHFCYIMAQVEFGTFEEKSSKMVLLSADHRLPFDEFATNEAIQCTEIYEYAQSLANPVYSLYHLQMYKFIYALRLVEHGFLEEALHYCEVISRHFLSQPTLYSYDLISEVYKLSTQLKYHDPHFFRGHGEFEEQEDPEWLISFANLIRNYNNILQDSHIQNEPISEPNQTVTEQMTSPDQNVSYQNISQPAMQTEMFNSVNNTSVYQPNNWGQPSPPMLNTASLANNQQDNHSYYQNEMVNNQSAFQFESSLPSHEENETTDVPSSPVNKSPPFDYYSNSPQQVSDIKQPSYDHVNSYTNASTRRERRDSALSSGSRYSASSLSVARKPSVKEIPKPELKKETKPSSQAGKTWLGGIFSRLLPKAPNQMILPDDQNPTIVWDEVQKRWVNKDSNDEDESNAPLAPPTDMELMGTKSSDIPTMPPGNSMPPTATQNKFQRPKTRGMRQNYVDVLNNSGATTKASIPPEALFPTPFEQPATSNMFVPPDNPASGIGESSTELDSTTSFNNSGLDTEEQPQVISTPMMFDPAEFDSRRSNVVSQRHTIGRTGRRTYPT